jgi:hypothetical protein
MLRSGPQFKVRLTLPLLLALILFFVFSSLSLNIPVVSAAFPEPASYYQIISRNSGKVVDVQAPNLNDGSSIGQWAWNSSLWQQWRLAAVSGGYYNIISRNSGKCIDISGASTADGALAIQWTCGTGTNQQFQLVVSGSYYQIKARHSGKCLDVQAPNLNDGAKIGQWTCSTATWQQWSFTATGTIAPTPTAPPGGNQNPALAGYYADPHAMIANGNFYIYPTTDGIAGWGATSFKAFSSPNLVDWTDRGIILNLANVSWCHANAWAPAMIQKGSTYYFYFSACQQIGVATSSSPTGPFTDARGSALVTTGQFGGQSIDPMVFIDDDGQAYLYFGQGRLNAVRLNADMKSLNGTPVNLATTGYNEGTFVFKRNGVYYFMWSENDTRSEDYRVAYGTSSSPLGPITNKGVILSKNLNLGIKGTGHHSVIKNSAGAYFIVYHRFAIPSGDGTHREVAIDKMEFNADGTIKVVTPTLGGIFSAVTP